MRASVGSAVREMVARYLAGEKTLAAFRRWFASSTWSVAAVEISDVDLVNRIELLLAEWSSDHLSEAELRRNLSDVLSHAQFNIRFVADGGRGRRVDKAPSAQAWTTATIATTNRSTLKTPSGWYQGTVRASPACT